MRYGADRPAGISAPPRSGLRGWLADSLRNSTLLARLRGWLADSLRNSTLLARQKLPPSKVAQFALVQLMLSAIVHGGLVHADTLEALATRLLQDLPVMDCLGGRVYGELAQLALPGRCRVPALVFGRLVGHVAL